MLSIALHQFPACPEVGFKRTPEIETDVLTNLSGQGGKERLSFERNSPFCYKVRWFLYSILRTLTSALATSNYFLYYIAASPT